MNAEKYNVILPRNILKIIRDKGLKQSAVAQWAGFSKQQFNDMLRGRRIIKACDVMAISEALGVSVELLFSDDET